MHMLAQLQTVGVKAVTQQGRAGKSFQPSAQTTVRPVKVKKPSGISTGESTGDTRTNTHSPGGT
jgi:hypothetical protein